MKTRRYCLALFIFVIATACSREKYRPVMLGRIGGTGDKIRVSGVPTLNWLDDKYYGGGQRTSRLQLVIESDRKDENGRSTEWLDTDTYAATPGKDEVVKRAHQLIDEVAKQKRPIELYGKYHFQGPVDNRSGAFIVLILHKVKVADQLFELQ